MKSPNSVLYHLSIWKDVIEDTFGHDTYYLYSEDQGRINGILPLVHIKGLFGNLLVSLPFFNYGGICSDKDEITDLLLYEAINVAKKKKVTFIELRHTRNLLPHQPAKIKKVSMRLSLPSDPENLWRSFSSKLRSQIRRPLKERMFHKFFREEGLDYFYSVFSENMRDLGTPVYPKKFFKNIFKSYKDAWICVVFDSTSKPIASGILLGFKDIIEIPWASSLRRFNRYAPNMLLYWSCLEFACNRGYKFFDFGRSTFGSSTYKFKEQWGATPHQLYWHYWTSNGKAVADLSPDNPKFRLAINIWKRMPLLITNSIGPKIVKYLP
ncbi:MAG: FemAB family PEP-CTERM system-associated protein [Thermodesulfovibrionales bacterium]|nr:FemAB family PEP-CTERM system-associated protein [Thermodesulfovibrionales bacterium]